MVSKEHHSNPHSSTTTPKCEDGKRFATLIDAGSAIVVGIDRRGRITFFSKGCEAVTGYTQEELIGKSFVKWCIPRKSQKTIRQHLRRFLSKGNPAKYTSEVVTKRGEGRIIQWTNTAILDAEGALKEIISTGVDITRQTQLQENYQTLVEFSTQGLLILQGGHVVLTNPAAAAIAGYSVEELTTMTATDLMGILHPEDQGMYLRRMQEMIAGNPTSQHQEYRFLRKDGDVRWVMSHSRRIEYRGAPAIQAAIIDITEQKRMEQALRDSEDQYRSLVEQSLQGLIVLQESPSSH
jgi:PAS domain S-box-containing protein